jgi:hypothetical protein
MIWVKTTLFVILRGKRLNHVVKNLASSRGLQLWSLTVLRPNHFKRSLTGATHLFPNGLGLRAIVGEHAVKQEGVGGHLRKFALCLVSKDDFAVETKKPRTSAVIVAINPIHDFDCVLRFGAS